MRCSYAHPNGRDRCVFTSIMLLGALFALSASPAARVPLVSALVLVGVPLMTFSVAAPSRIGLVNELRLLLRGGEALVLRFLCLIAGRREMATHVRRRYRDMVGAAYRASGEQVADATDLDVERLMHARRLGAFAGLLGVLAGLGLPFTYPSVYTFGDGFDAVLVFGLDLVAFGLASRLVGERIVLRLFEATHALRDGSPSVSRLRATPLMAVLGGALGAVGALVIVSVGAMACAVETWWIEPQLHSLAQPAFWFLRWTAPNALPLGIGAGAIIGAGVGLAQARLDDDA